MKQLIVKTAQGYYEAAKNLNNDGEEYSEAEKKLFMDEVINHTESALAYTIRLLNKAQYYLDEEHSYIAREIRQEIIEHIKKFNIEL